jgi:ATP-dependent protease Clp ATPase subunit
VRREYRLATGLTLATLPGMATCGFCGTRRGEARALFAGPGVYICDACVSYAESVLREADEIAPPSGTPRTSSPVESRCSFCDRTSQQVRRLVAGPDVWICDGCVHVADEVLAGRSY